jgi:divalent metal cation (Fe/Co/Zn/Cd) transporter
MRKEDPDFPIGKTRLETLGVIACAIIMGLASFEVLASAATQLWKGFAQHQYPTLEFGALMYIILGATTALKVRACAIYLSRHARLQAYPTAQFFG